MKFQIHRHIISLSLTIRKTPQDDDGLETSFFFICPVACFALRLFWICMGFPRPSFATSLVRIKNAYQRLQNAQSDPHFLLLLMPDNLIFQCTQSRDLAGRGRRAPKLRQYWKGRRSCHDVAATDTTDVVAITPHARPDP